ncbi:MAG: P-II family nitrogen regulator, partial [Phycisphaerae bacterium]
MRLIIAYIQPEKLNDVKQALYAAKVYKLSVTNALGCGQQRGYTETYRGVEAEVNLLKKVRLEIAVNEDFV